MASVRSLGLHHPPALPFLINEGLLPLEPSDDDYVWYTQRAESDDDITYTKNCAVWSRSGVVKRVFKVEIEKEEIRHVVLTTFPSVTGRENTRKSDTNVIGVKDVSIGRAQNVEEEDTARVVVAPIDHGFTKGRLRSQEDDAKALVVVLKTQAHIFFLAGNTHVVPLPFEVDFVFASPRGLIFQRRIPDVPTSVPGAPPNSFLSQTFTESRKSDVFRSSRTRDSRFSSIAQPSRPQKKSEDDMPRTFSLTDPQSEMGHVVANQSTLITHGAQDSWAFDSLDPTEEIVYVSAVNELTGDNVSLTENPLVLVVTMNTETGLYTIWTAKFRTDASVRESKKRKKPLASGARSKRRSSHYGMATGATTPVARPSGLRESIGAGRNIHAASFSHSFQSEDPPEQTDFASQMGQEFDDIGVPSKTSRRVSSLLARTDLGASQDRQTFSDLATGNPGGATNHGSLRQSIGAYSTRASFGYNLRSSLAGNASIFSNTSSFLDAPVDRLLEELNSGGDFEGFESMDLTGPMSGLPKEMMLRKVESFSAGLATGSFSFSELKRNRSKSKAFTLRPNENIHQKTPSSARLALCLLDPISKCLVVVDLKVQSVKSSERDKKKRKTSLKGNEISTVVHAIGIQHSPNVMDVCKIVDNGISRMLTLKSTMDGKGELALQSPWSPSIKIELPSKLSLHTPDDFSIVQNRAPDTGLKRVIGDPNLKLAAFGHSCSRGQVDVIDAEKRCHRIEVQLQPRNPFVKKALAVCRFALRESLRAADGLYTAWWEVLRWLSSRDSDENDLEWTAFVVVLFTMGVGFIDSPQAQTLATKKRRRKANILRSSSGSYIDQESWESMTEKIAGSSGVAASWMMNSSWAWASDQKDDKAFLADQNSRNDQSKNSYLLRCVSLARDFFESPQGEAASGSEGYLPTALCQSQETRRTALCSILVGLHLLREEQKLSICDSESSYQERGMLAPVLAQIGGWVGWNSWTWKEDGYYGTEMATMSRWVFEDSRISGLNMPPEPFVPPSIFAHLQNSITTSPSTPFSTLLDVFPGSSRTSDKQSLRNEVSKLTPRTLAINGFMSEVHQATSTVDKVKILLRWGLTINVIESLPEGVSAPLFELIVRCQMKPPVSCTAALIGLIDRDDLYMSMEVEATTQPTSRPQIGTSHVSLRDVHHIGASTLDFELSNSFEASVEADRMAITRLMYREDRRLQEASKLLNQSKAPVAQCVPEPEWTDSELLEAQKEVVQLVTLRTLSVPAGRALFMFSCRAPLLTEKLPIPSFSLQCLMKPSNVTISADRSAFNEEKVCWAFFHNGAATGLAISKASKGIDTSWILYNKPQELTNRHAGFLLALGLNGHLKNLAKWVAFKYLTPKHTMTSIGLLLGLSVSYLGTMDTLITRLLSVHVTRMLPQGAAELNLSPLTQTAGIMGIGLLYCDSQHRRMSEVLLSEIENVGQEEAAITPETLRDEGYRLAAGFALGFINLGKGKDLQGLRDMQLVERLLAIAIGTKNVDLVHILDRATAGATVALAIIFMKTNDEMVARKIDIPDTIVQFDYVRPDIFLLRTLARHLIMWDNIEPSFEWLLRSIPKSYRKRHTLSTIKRLSSDDMSFFNIIAGLCFAIGLRYAGSAHAGARDLLIRYLDQFRRIVRLPAPHYDSQLARNSVRHCQDILAISAAAVMAGTGDLNLFRRLRSLHGRIDPDTTYGSHMAAHMAIGLLFLGGGCYTLGTSNLAIASMLCAFYPLFPTSVLDNKCHLQAFRHLWVLAAEPRCLIARDVDTRRPIAIPVSLHMKDGTTRETTAPCLLPNLEEIVAVKAHSRDHWPLVLDFNQNEKLRGKFRKGDQSIYLRRNTTYDPSGSSVFASTLLGLSEAQDILPSTTIGSWRRPIPNSVALLMSQGRRSKAINNVRQDVWDWIFSLRPLRGLDVGDRSVVLPPSATFQFQSRALAANDEDGTALAMIPPWLRVSSVDSRLVLESIASETVAGVTATGHAHSFDEIKDRLWQLRLLFDWVDRQVKTEREEQDGEEMTWVQQSIKVQNRASPVVTAEIRKRKGGGLWLNYDVIEQARWKIWGIQVGDLDQE
ncbi:20S cyclosome subunit (APC1/BimE), putative [Talaromyces stipitatus ATCC 10500]|uniref:20S cyclosome subunit (APC1/BimE), putative n=1 Tax=Talaromyces stipitatus (strain ATCC 10500 / CBS 375.48 / QM 6759 / NRRL 1006) TaxID=441959 RepID=B8MNG9_TALSN|nr:20S cyclosome subunit (APC1/BimE), putative [Talaromyces stipitatus ATCC 10500]EED14058.1 20S cyclosome subunit (APC1/BimE), putative [Talaromyces stipitatus ATCC 10500]